MLAGIYRDRLINGMYQTLIKWEAGWRSGVYRAGFAYFLPVSGALSVSFIPVLNQRLASGNKAIGVERVQAY